MARTYTETVTLQEVTCKSCGITHAIPQRFIEGAARRRAAITIARTGISGGGVIARRSGCAGN